MKKKNKMEDKNKDEFDWDYLSKKIDIKKCTENFYFRMIGTIFGLYMAIGLYTYAMDAFNDNLPYDNYNIEDVYDYRIDQYRYVTEHRHIIENSTVVKMIKIGVNRTGHFLYTIVLWPTLEHTYIKKIE